VVGVEDVVGGVERKLSGCMFLNDEHKCSYYISFYSLLYKQLSYQYSYWSTNYS
jgi:hypothetical protein